MQYKDHPYFTIAYHGTLFDNLLSIISEGFKKPSDKSGKKSIDIREGHFPKMKVYDGKFKFADASFLSPSPLCSNCYA